MFIIRIITIAALLIGGIIASAPVLSKKFDWLEKHTESLKKFDLIIGFILIFIGLFKIFVPEGTASWEQPMTRHFFIGDLFPMLACLLLGLVLCSDFIGKILTKVDQSEHGLISFANLVRIPAGISSIIIAILHNFLFYYILF